jgi:hypothetical protein
MDCDIYSVTLRDDGWALVLNEQDIAAGMEQDCAERAAAVAARFSERRGRIAFVLTGEADSAQELGSSM